MDFEARPACKWWPLNFLERCFRFTVRISGYAAVILVLACSETSFIGEEFFGDEGFQVSYVDSVRLDMYTIRFDSLPTSNTGRLLLGRGSFEGLGEVVAEAYFLLSPDANAASGLEEDHQFDSLTMILRRDGYSYGLEDDNIYRKILVERLNVELAYRSDGSLYNISEVVPSEENLTQIGSEEVRLSEDRMEEIEITLDADFGQDLFQKIIEEDQIYFTDYEFQQYVKGFRIRFDTSVYAPFIGLKTDSVQMRLYYSNQSEIPGEQGYFDFFVSGAPYYSRLIHNPIEPFDELKTLENEVSTTLTGQVGMITGGLGYAIRVDFPGIRNLLLDGSDYLIASAELRLIPVNAEESSDPLPDQLKAFYVNDYNVTVTDDLFYATLHPGDEFGRDVYYTLDVSALVENLLEPLTVNKYSILLTMDTEYLNTSVHQVRMGNESFKSELILYTISTK